MWNFSQLAQFGTRWTAKLTGLWQAASAIITLLLVAGGLTIIGPILTGAVIEVEALIGAFITRLAVILGMAILNFLWQADINRALLSARDITEGTERDHKNPIDVTKLVKHLCAELNVYFSAHEKFKKTHQDLNRPRLYTFTSQKPEIITFEGYNPSQAAIFFSTMMFNSAVTGLSQLELAALIRVELNKIYFRRGWLSIIAGVVTDFFATLKNLYTVQANPEEGPGMHLIGAIKQTIGSLLVPFHFFFLLQMAVKRAATYEAAQWVPEFGQGVPLINANDKKVDSTAFLLPPRNQTNAKRNNRLAKMKQKIPFYQGWGQSIIQPIQAFIDAQEPMASSIKNYNSRFIRGIGNIISEGWIRLNELLSENPRNTNLNREIRKKTTCVFNGELISYETLVSPEQLQALIDAQDQISRNLLAKIPEKHRYLPLTPAQKGFAPKVPRSLTIQEAAQLRLQKAVAVNPPIIDNQTTARLINKR